MTLGWRLFMLAVLLPVLPILYVMLRDECEPKKNIIVGVTLPYAAQSDSVVRGLLEQYKREMRLACWAMLAAAIPNLLFSGFGSFLTYWLVWVVALCVVPFIPYIRCNKALRQLKEARGWKRAPDAPPGGSRFAGRRPGNAVAVPLVVFAAAGGQPGAAGI